MVAAAHRRRGIGTRADARGRGVGAPARGVTKLELHVFPHNEPAIALYEKLGYEREGFRRAPLPPPRRPYSSTRS